MRISDWSSDVCSSDLGGGDRGGGVVDRIGHEHVSGLHVLPPRRGGLDADKRPHRLASMAKRTRDAARAGAHQGRVFRPCVRGGCPDTRSEEHTSELQSLMRISYAVFCLKKQNSTRVHVIKS